MKSKRKALGILLGFIAIFIFFLYLLLRPSAEAKGMNAVNNSMNIEDVKSAWYKYKEDIFGNQSAKADVLQSDFLKAVYTKLDELHPSKAEINKINDWLPAQENLNIIIVPDLSARIKDSLNNPDQVHCDTVLLNTIWHAFEEATKLKMNSKDRLTVDVSDPDQSQGQFKVIADQLVFDLSTNKGRSNRLYFPGKQQLFTQNIGQLYQTALKQTTGADYSYYFSKILPTRIKNNTIADMFRNLVFIPTDGYFEITSGKSAVSITPNSDALKAYCQGKVTPVQLPTSTMDVVLPTTEVYLFEVRERKRGQGCDARGLKHWWKEWFKSMEVRNIPDDNFFIEHQDAMSHTKDMISEIIH